MGLTDTSWAIFSGGPRDGDDVRQGHLPPTIYVPEPELIRESLLRGLGEVGDSTVKIAMYDLSTAWIHFGSTTVAVNMYFWRPDPQVTRFAEVRALRLVAKDLYLEGAYRGTD